MEKKSKKKTAVKMARFVVYKNGKKHIIKAENQKEAEYRASKL